MFLYSYAIFVYIVFQQMKPVQGPLIYFIMDRCIRLFTARDRRDQYFLVTVTHDHDGFRQGHGHSRGHRDRDCES